MVHLSSLRDEWRMRDALDLERIVTGLVYALAAVTVIYHLYYAFETPYARTLHSNIHLALLLSIFFLTILEFSPGSWRDHLKNALAITLLGLLAVVAVYFHLNYERWLMEGRNMLIYTDTDLLIGLGAMIIVFAATWLSFGRVLGIVILSAIIYGLAGPVFPGIFFHSGYSAEDIIFMNTIQLDGVYGSLLGISSTWVGIFVLFAGLVEGYGGLGAVIGVARASSRYMKSGAIQAAVISSMILGSIMASSTANTATTGSFTIPLMKSQGVRPKTAAAIEAVVSNGGQILPPVMGSSAFIMAQILGISYFEVIQGAFLPAILFYVVCVLLVHLLTLKNGWGVDAISLVDSDSGSDITSGYYNNIDKDVTVDYSGEGGRGNLVNDLIPLIIGILVLVITLVVLRYSPLTAAGYTILILAPTVLLRDVVREGASVDVVTSWIKRSLNGCRLGAQNMAPITAVLGSLGIVVVILSASGFSHRLSLGIVSIAVGLFMVLIFAMFASILFGMGLPTPAAYVVVAILTAPALVEFGINPLVAHMFVFNFALLSSITPPVALAAAVGAGIAGTKFWDTALESVRLGLFAFIIPYMYVQNQELIIWNGTETAVTFVLALVGVFSLSIAIAGYDWRNSIGHLERGVYFAFAAPVLFTSIRNLQVVSSLALVVFWLYRSRLFRSSSAVPESDA